MTAAPMHDVKSAAAVLADDVICQSFIQSSSTLAYSCLLIRRGEYELASHVLHSLEAKQASRFKDMVFYLQAQIGIETGEHAAVKRRLVPRVNQHPNDMVALSLLESCIYLEFVEWEKTHPRPEVPDASGALDVSLSGSFSSPVSSREAMFGNAQAAYAASQAASYNDTPVPAAPARDRGPAVFSDVPALTNPPEAPEPIERFTEAPVAPVPVQSAPWPQAAPAVPSPAAMAASAPAAPAASAAMAASAASPGRVQYAPPTGTAQDADFGPFQSLANDVNTQAIALWNPEKGRFKSACRNADLEPLVAMLPYELPLPIQSVCTALDAGIVNKICFSFQAMTVTSFHSGSENLGLITGHINQSLLSIVRAENTFRKQSATLAQAASAASNRNVEYAPNE